MIEGTKLGRYEIRKKIGAGGMGEVYLAQDEQLDRSVALKVLLPEFCSNAERVQRFKLEAKAASTLNHPNIITIHEVGETAERIYIATEYVNGVTLRDKIEEGNLTVLDAIEITQQLADALAVAHEAHIVHRDIKPENVMIRRDGYVKILDFGLAKSILYQQPGNEDKTLQMVHTQPGLVMGSVRYMSPEQARGKDVDNRTDVWSLGVVLYEMLSGKNPFDGETVSDSIAALIHLDPAPLENVPEDLQSVVKKALRKNVEERYSSVRDFALDLRDVKNRLEHGSDEQKAFLNKNPTKTISVERYDTSENKTLLHNTVSADMIPATKSISTPVAAARSKSLWRFAPLLILLAAVLLAAGMFYANYTGKPVKPAFESLQVSRITSDGKASLPTLSSDGKYLAYINTEKGLRSLVVKETATDKTTQIVAPTNLGFYAPTFSPDNSSIYYVTQSSGIGTLYQIPLNGGTAKSLIKDVDSKVSFSPNAKSLVFIRHNSVTGISTIIIAENDGTNERPLITSAELGNRKFANVAWSPTEDLLFVDLLSKMVNSNWVEASFHVISIRDKSHRQVSNKTFINPNSFEWVKDGSGVYFVAGNKDGTSGQIRFLSYPSGEERQISNDLNGYHSMTIASDSNTIVASSEDTIYSVWAYNPQTKNLLQLTPESRRSQGTSGIIELPNGRILFTVGESGQNDFWTMNQDGTDRKPLASHVGIDTQPIVTLDGRYIVFSSNRSGNFNIWRMDIDGENPVQLVDDSQGNNFHPQSINEGKTIVYDRNELNTSRIELAKVSIDGGKPEILTENNQTDDLNARVSNNGKKMIFISQSLDVPNLIFRSNLNIVDLQGEVINPQGKEISQSLGYVYQWTKDNKALSYINSMGIDNIFNYSPESNSTVPVTNFNTGSILNFSWSNDGKKLYIARAIKNSDLILIKDGTAAAKQ